MNSDSTTIPIVHALRRGWKPHMQRLLPALRMVWIDHGADEDWGPLCYPPMRAAH